MVYYIGKTISYFYIGLKIEKIYKPKLDMGIELYNIESSFNRQLRTNGKSKPKKHAMFGIIFFYSNIMKTHNEKKPHQ